MKKTTKKNTKKKAETVVKKQADAQKRRLRGGAKAMAEEMT